MTISLDGHGYHIVIAPEYGATILSADWQSPDGTVHALLEPLENPEIAMNAGCFVMAPFTNRIRYGRFSYNGQEYEFPMNRATDGMACHGYARDHAWNVSEKSATTATCSYQYDGIEYPWKFHIRQDFSLSENGLSVRITLTNIGAQCLPYGIGLHPWFPRDTDTTISFIASGAYTLDDINLPLPDVVPIDAFAPNSETPLGQMPHFDRCFEGWAPRCATLHYPTRKMGIRIRAFGDLDHIHIYAPTTRQVFCVEPVSHAPDAINRPDLKYAAMKPLRPTEEICGTMELSAYHI